MKQGTVFILFGNVFELVKTFQKYTTWEKDKVYM